jgi:hypothetical protein
VASWKRIQGSQGNWLAYGYCEYEQPESTLRALRVLHNLRLGGKALVLKVGVIGMGPGAYPAFARWTILHVIPCVNISTGDASWKVDHN